MENYEKMLSTRPDIKQVNWQREALSDEKVLNEKKVVIAAGTSSGKSLFMTMLLNLYFSNKENKNKKALFIPSGQTNLRLNIEETFDFFKPDFSYVIAKSCEELEAAVNSNVQVIVCLPQTVARCIDVLPKLDKFVLDEAHTWYFQKTIKNIVKKSKPEQQLLLTGTPAPFILRGGFHMYFVPVMDLFNEGRIANTEVHVVASNYNFKEEDYNVEQNLTLSSRTKAELSSEDTFRKVVLGMIKKLKNPIKGMKNLNRLTNEAGGLFFNYLEKTIIWANSIQQADKFAQVLRDFNGLQNAVLVSHSENDDESELMEKFKNDKDIKVLVTVNRGRMGWSYTELFNAVDFTMTRNLSSILQMMARLFRISKTNPNKKKIFYKVSNAKDAGYYTVIMKGVLLLLDREWYSQFNGKNFHGMQIPVTVPRRRVVNPNGTRRPGRPRTNYRYEMLDIPLDLNFFKTVYAKQDDAFSTVAWTTISEVRKQLFNIQAIITPDYVKAIVKRYKTRNAFMKDHHMLGWYIQSNKLSDEYYSHMPDYVIEKNKNNKKFITNWLMQYRGMSLEKVRSLKGDVYKADGRNLYNGSFFVNQAYKLGIDLRSIFKVRKVNKDTITKEDVIELAKTCESSSKFQKKYQRAYFHALKNNYANELTQYYTGTGYVKIVRDITTGEEGTYSYFKQKYGGCDSSIYNLIKKDRPAKSGVFKGKHFKYVNNQGELVN